MAKPPFIEGWRFGTLFGQVVVCGYVEGKRICRLLRYWSHGQFGVSVGGKNADTRYRVGREANS